MKKISSICILAITLFSQGTYADDGKSTYCPGLGDMYASERAKHNGEKNNPNYCSEQESIDKKYDRRLNFMQEQLDLHCGNHYPKETVNAADKEIVTINCKL